MDQFRSARLMALSDSESFDQIIYVVERLGSYLSKENLGDKGRHGDLGKYRSGLVALVNSGGVDARDRTQLNNLLTPFETLYDLVKDARNDALHQGAFARHLTKHAIELAIILEEVLSADMAPMVMDFMVRNPLCGEPWQPIAFLRQQMLANSFSYLPVETKDGQWRVLSDAAVAIFLGPERNSSDRTKRLAMTLEEGALQSERPVMLIAPEFVDETASLDRAINKIKECPILLVRRSIGEAGIIGIVTAFDLL